ncbi:MAG: Asp-tRNA(Asn)/Glu-tRNA(Gln) amidotransferase subunit GatC [Minisyncoccota bacterium]
MKEDEIKNLALLARIALSADEETTLAGDLDAILGYVSEIQAVEGVVPEHIAGKLRNVMREDRDPHQPGTYTNDLIAAAPRTEGNYIKVQQVI